MSSHDPTRYDLQEVDEGKSEMVPHRYGDWVTYDSYNELLSDFEKLTKTLAEIEDLARR